MSAPLQPRIPSAVLGTLLFAATEAMLFLGLGASFVILRSSYINWPPLGQPRLPWEVTALNTLVLVASGIFAESASRALSKGDRELAEGRMRWAFSLGATFLAVQGWEWFNLMRYGLDFQTVYGSLFYATVGTHAFHVTVSLAVLHAGLRGIRNRSWSAEGIAALRCWWWFVVGIWPMIYVLVYLW